MKNIDVRIKVDQYTIEMLFWKFDLYLKSESRVCYFTKENLSYLKLLSHLLTIQKVKQKYV